MKNYEVDRIEKAKKMFDKCGWEIIDSEEDYILKRKKYGEYLIILSKRFKTVTFNHTSIELNVMKALNTMIFELGWYKQYEN